MRQKYEYNNESDATRETLPEPTETSVVQRLFKAAWILNLIEVFKARKRRTELSQSIARIVICAIILAYMVISYSFGEVFPNQQLIIWVVAAFLLYSIGLNIAIRLYPKPIIWRRGLAIIADLAVTSFGFNMAGSFGGAFYPLYLWVIVGNGLRFGVPYLLFAMIIGVTGLTIAVTSSDYWTQHSVLAIGLMIGIVILPLFYAVILRELKIANLSLEKQMQETAYAATHDALTDLPNRFLFIDRLQQAINRSKRHKNRIALLFIDLDKFKNINDSLGHSVGDSLLVSVGNRIRTTLRSNDSVARLGGDEFIVLLNDLNTRYYAQEAARRIIKIFNTSYECDGHSMRIGGSIGISIYPDDANNIDKLINYADSAMYKAKKNGGNTFCVYSNMA